MLWLAVFGPEYGHLWGAEVGLPPWTAASALAGSFIFAQYCPRSAVHFGGLGESISLICSVSGAVSRIGSPNYFRATRSCPTWRAQRPDPEMVWKRRKICNDMTVEKALQKLSKLKASNADLKILLLEQDSVAGSVFS